MNNIKYRKIYLEENWGHNHFIKVYKEDDSLLTNNNILYSGKDDKLCIGYELYANPIIFRPIFSHTRQIFLDSVNTDIINSNTFWNKVKLRYFLSLYDFTNLPTDCISYVVTFIY